jgi:RNA polymerase sigma factor (sigma-70 family)
MPSQRPHRLGVTRTARRRHRRDVADSCPESLDEAYRKYADELTRFATGLVGPHDASDIVSSALLRCLSSGSWESVRDERSYLYKAVLNRARQVRRSSLRRAAREARSAPSATTVDADPRPEVLEAVGRLSLRQRAVVVLTYWADLSPSEIAGRLDIGEGSVRRHLARARARLRRELDD